MYPEWGGVAILNGKPLIDENDDSSTTDTIKKEQLAPVMAEFAGQLRQMLLGEKPIDPTRGHPHPDRLLERAHLAETIPTHLGLTYWELDSLVTRHTVALLGSTRRTLESLDRLLKTITELPVGDRISLLVAASLEHLQNSLDLLRKGDWSAGNKASKKAAAAAEAAFFDPSMVGRAYFPQDHKYAVYTPLFFPVVLPVLNGIVRLVLEAVRGPTNC